MVASPVLPFVLPLWLSLLASLAFAVPLPVASPGGPAGVASNGAAGVPSPGALGEPSPGARSWPVDGGSGGAGSGTAGGVAGGRPVVERGFEPPASPWGRGHRGVDLRAGPGTPVRSAAPGRVSFAGRVAGVDVVSVLLPGGLRTTYEPVRAQVAVGDEVTAGQVVGVLERGPWHCPAGCLHWGLLRGDVYLDPLTLLPDWMKRGGRSRLLPVFGVPEPAAGTGTTAVPRGGSWPNPIPGPVPGSGPGPVPGSIPGPGLRWWPGSALRAGP
nr:MULTISPECIES: M23 family metallopeptidase [unclassified Streptomyces]